MAQVVNSLLTPETVLIYSNLGERAVYEAFPSNFRCRARLFPPLSFRVTAEQSWNTFYPLQRLHGKA